MPTYYVWTPDSDVRAEVEAPDTRHARTTYLDYLHRGGIIDYTDRQRVRERVMTKRIQPGAMAGETDVVLDYDMRDGGGGYPQVMEEPLPVSQASEASPSFSQRPPSSTPPTPPTTQPLGARPHSGNMQSLTPGASGAVGKSLKSLILPAGGVRATESQGGDLMLPAKGSGQMMIRGGPSVLPPQNVRRMY